MIRTLCAPVLLLALAGCTGAEAVPVTYSPAALVSHIHQLGRPVVPTEQLETVQITWRRVTPAQLRVIEQALDAGAVMNIHGVALLETDTRVCTVYAVAPTVDGSPEMTVFGHEMLHCFDGFFHGPYGGGRPSGELVRAWKAELDSALAAADT